MSPFPIVARQLKFLIVGIDYFTKWVEVEALATFTEKNVRSFVQRYIICRYGIPRVLVSDNKKQFNNDSFRDFCLQLGIKNHYSPATLKPMDRLRSQTDPCLKLSRLGLRGQRVYGLRNCQAYYGHTGQQLKHLQGKHHFDQHTDARRLFQLKSSSQATGWTTIMKRRTTKLYVYSSIYQTRIGQQLNKDSLDTKTSWPSTTTPGSDTKTFRLEISF